MKNYADITVLLDRSGSMQSIRAAMESGFDEFVGQHRQNSSTRLTLIQFDGVNDQEVLYTARPINDVPRLSIDPRGWTPLLDALCKTIDATGSRLRSVSERDRPNKVLFVVITDGQENRSKTYTRRDVKERIDRQRGAYSWEFVYLGANQDAIAEAATFGIPHTHAITYSHDSFAALNTMRGMARNTANYVSTGSTDALNFDDKQRKEAEQTTTSK